jgi:protein-disulfide isomerase
VPWNFWVDNVTNVVLHGVSEQRYGVGWGACEIVVKACDNRRIVSLLKTLPNAVLVLTLSAVLGCHAQTPAAASKAGDPVASSGTPLSLEQARRVEVLVRQKAQLPPGSALEISGRMPSQFSGWDKIWVTVSNDGHKSHPIQFLLTTDGKQLAQLTEYDISANPRDLIAQGDRPARGGPKTAPVLIVGFDDLECPYCARLHESIFPALTQRYGDKVRIVYKDYPLESIHPWAMHAAVDVNCLADQSPDGYWTLVDQIHAHSDDITTAAQKETDPKKALDKANEQLDSLTAQMGKDKHVDDAKLDACVKKQDQNMIRAEMKLGDSFNLESAPVLFINGAKVEGAVPVEYIFGAVDDALKAEGVTPPAPYVPATPAVQGKTSGK